VPNDHSPRAPAPPASSLPPLAPALRIDRQVSVPEYYHASVAASGRTLETPRENAFCIEGRGVLPAAAWQSALDRVSAQNPGTRLRLRGDSCRARWDSNGPLPRVRMVDHCEWDGYSDRGANVIYETPLPLDTGPTVELVVIARPGGRTLLVARNHHAVMDGMGTLHFLHELFRALRGEPLQGTNAAFSDADLMRSVGAKHTTSKHARTRSLTGLPEGDAKGDEWRRFSLGKPRKNLLGLIAAAMAEFTHRHTDLPALIAIPVDLRRHAAGLLSTANFTNMLLVRLDKGEGADVFRQRLGEMIEQKMDAVYPRHFEILKWFSLARVDRIASRTDKNYRTKGALETAVISNLGRVDATLLSGAGYRAERLFVIPLKGTVFSTIVGNGDEVEMTLNVPRVLGSGGRFDAVVDFLRARFADDRPSATPAA
jgi:hypothetical protein